MIDVMTNTPINPTHEDSNPTHGSVMETLKEKSERVARSVSNAVDQAKDKSNHLVDEGSNRIGSSLSHITETSDKMRRKMESGYRGKVAPAITKANQKLSKASDYLQQSSPSDFLTDIYQAGKKHPRVTVAALLGAGFVLGRLFTSKPSAR